MKPFATVVFVWDNEETGGITIAKQFDDPLKVKAIVINYGDGREFYLDVNVTSCQEIPKETQEENKAWADKALKEAGIID